MGCKPKMAGCPATCGHRQIVQGYREEYQRQNDELWERSGGYRTEYDDNKRQLREDGTPLPQFKDWLKGIKREPMTEVPLTMNQLDNKALGEGVPLLSPRHLAGWSAGEGQQFLSDPAYVHPSVQNEALLLSTALSSEQGVTALRVIEPREFRSSFHVNVRQAILDQADQGLPHDGGAVTDVLRSRRLDPYDRTPPPLPEGPYGLVSQEGPAGVPWVAPAPVLTAWRPPAPANTQLPSHFDPNEALQPPVPALYGLRAWETYSPPAFAAPGFAQTVRSEYRAREMEAICDRGAAMARGAIEYGDTGMVENDLVGQVRMTLANELREFPPALDGKLQPVKAGATQAAQVLPGQRVQSGPDLEPVTLAKVEQVPVIDNDLRLPPAPVLSGAGREVLTRG